MVVIERHLERVTLRKETAQNAARGSRFDAVFVEICPRNRKILGHGAKQSWQKLLFVNG